MTRILGQRWPGELYHLRSSSYGTLTEHFAVPRSRISSRRQKHCCRRTARVAQFAGNSTTDYQPRTSHGHFRRLRLLKHIIAVRSNKPHRYGNSHSAYSESVRRRRVRGGTGRARPVRYDAGPKRPVVDRSTSRSHNDFNLHDFSLHTVASRVPSARRDVAWSLCTA